MTIDIITNLITSYISTSHYLESQIYVEEVNRYLKYRLLQFKYCGRNVEIRIHNSKFIEVKVNSEFGCICDCYRTVRDKVDNLSSTRYA